MTASGQNRREFLKTVGMNAALIAMAGNLAADDQEAPAGKASLYDEPYRPQFHFSPPSGWMNDPCGMVYYKGEYHLHYLYNPDPKGWGIMYAHLVSRDLVHWKHLEPSVKVSPELGSAGSGSAVVDWNNSSGLQTGDEKALLLFFTIMKRETKDQTVGVAYSNDRGRTWQQYSGNPILTRPDDNTDFRDPNVMWHEPTQQWVMVISRGYRPEGDVFVSSDLKHWKHAGKAPNGECPDLFQLSVPDTNEKKWLYLCGDFPMTPPEVGAKYFVGEFDGRSFQAETDPLRLGGNFFVGQSFFRMPGEKDRRIWMGWKWLRNEGDFGPWTGGIQTIPVELTLGRNEDRALHLVYRPVEELRALRGKHLSITDQEVTEGCSILSDRGIESELFECIAEFQLDSAKEFGLSFRRSSGSACTVGYDAAESKIVFHDPVGKTKLTQPLAARSGKVQLHLLVDRSVVDVFGNGGQTWNCAFFKADPGSNGIELYAKEGAARLLSMDFWELKSIWR